MKEITTGKGVKILVDDEDFEYLNSFKWYLSRGYAINAKREKMHRIITKAKDGEIVDHIDRCILNNTKENLRIVCMSENVHNQSKRKNTKNKYKGTHFIKRLGLWQSRCRIYKNDFILGLFKTEIAAAYAYNKKALELSEFIYLNELEYTIDELEKMLITDRSKIIPAENVSKYKGVYWHKKNGRMKCGKWTAKLRLNGKYISLGNFIDEEEAYKALINGKKKYGII